MKLLRVPTAAKLWGFSTRHFRRLLDKYKIEIQGFPVGNRETFFVRDADIKKIPKKKTS